MTRLFRSAAACLATVLLAAACTDSDPLSPSTDRPATAKAAFAKKVGGTTGAAVAIDSTIKAPTAVQSGRCLLGGGSDSTATPADSTGGDCFGDTLPWGRVGDTIPWGK